jgi:sugar phosphate isomerase/epimerase
MPIANASIAVCSWSLQPTSAIELIERLAAVNARSVQLALTPLVEHDAAWHDTFELLRDAGIEVISGMLETVGEDYSTLDTIRASGGVVPDGSWSATEARARKIARLAGMHGVTLVTLHAGFIPHEASALRDTLFARLRALSTIFAAQGAKLAFETGQESADTLAHALDALGDETIGVNFDPANMILYGMGDPVAAIKHLAPRIVQVHVKDALPSQTVGSWGSEVRAGTGAVEWRAFLAELAAVPRPLRLAIEREAGDDRVGDIRAASALLASLL